MRYMAELEPIRELRVVAPPVGWFRNEDGKWVRNEFEIWEQELDVG